MENLRQSWNYRELKGSSEEITYEPSFSLGQKDKFGEELANNHSKTNSKWKVVTIFDDVELGTKCSSEPLAGRLSAGAIYK